MAFKLVLVSALMLAGLQEILGHGSLWDPVNRSSAWKKSFRTPKNYNDFEMFCGGLQVLHQINGGKCGPCGDDYRRAQPRQNENGGTYGTGTIVKTYQSGQRTTLTVRLTANHKGYFQFALCPLNDPKAIETEECFAAHPIKLADGSDRFYPGPGSRDFNVDVVLPAGLTCKHCSLRWHYQAANNWGVCPGNPKMFNCGAAEIFRSCSDVAIL